MADDIVPVEPVELVAPTAEEAAQTAEENEWNDAAKDVFADKIDKKEVPKDEPTNPQQDAKTPKTQTIDPNETPEQKTAREAKEAADGDAGDEDAKNPNNSDSSGRDARQAAREFAQQTEAVKSDVREKMFADVPQVLKDADGDPINSIEDVMRLKNPRTGEAFTEEEAGMWLLSAQQQFNQNIANVEKEIERISDVNLDLKDQADSIAFNYGELLKEMPELRDRLWTEYEKTLVKDPASGVITKNPVSLKSFYEMALKPYAELAEKLEVDAAETSTAEVAATNQAEATKKQTRQDRSDIFGGGKTEEVDSEDKEWADAATAVFGPRK